MTPDSRPIRFFHRGALVEVDGVAPTLSVLDWLREHAHCTGTKEGCNEGDCGACTVVVGELAAPEDTTSVRGLRLRTVNSCLQFLPTLDGKALFSVEDLTPPTPRAASAVLHPVQEAMVRCHGSQCGFCTPGFVMSLYAHYEHHLCAGSRPSRQQSADALAGNLCRCTGYRPILDAAERMFDAPAVTLDFAPAVEALQRLANGPPLLYSAVVPRHPGSAAVAPHTPESNKITQTFAAPRTVNALAQALEAAPHSRILAGSTDVGLWVNKQHRALGPIVYVGAVTELKAIAAEAGGLRIGAGASLEDAWGALATRHPELTEVALRFASPPVRHAGTLGGNIANGSPIGDGAPVLMALDADIGLRRGSRERSMPLSAFYLDYMKNQLDPGEFVQWLWVPQRDPAWAVRAYKVSKRFDSDISALCGGFAVLLAGDRIQDVRLAFGGMAAIVKRAQHAEAALRGQIWNETALEQAQLALTQDFTPLTDLRASAAYRSAVAANLLRRLWLETRTDAPLPPTATRVWAQREPTAIGGAV